MKNFKKLLAMLLVVVMLLSALPVVSMAAVGDVGTDRMYMYAVATSHLDTVWQWSYEDTINLHIPKTLTQNAQYFEDPNYDGYEFNWEGARRYALMKEYYPDLYEQMAGYIADGRWHTTGSAWENGDVNSPSPEGLMRNVLYGNLFFANEFGNEHRTTDIYLPDCFGFGAAMPHWMNHMRLNAFSTQKLTWGNTFLAGHPFSVGSWSGVGDDQVFASIKMIPYESDDGGDMGGIMNGATLRDARFINSYATENKERYGWYAVPFYFGIGDQGGAPQRKYVDRINNAYKINDTSNSTVVFSTSTRWIDELTDAQKESMINGPYAYKGELLMREHGAGTYTSRTYGHRWNSRNELLAVEAETAALASQYLGTGTYPMEKFTEAWLRVIGHQFHDDITGTSWWSEYIRSWNEYWISLNQFGEEYEAAVSGVASLLDTNVQGIPVVVNNPVEFARDDMVTAEVDMGEVVNSVRVYDVEGNEVPSQIISRDGTVVEIIFKASVPSLGYSVYDVRKSDAACDMDTDVSVNGTTLQNSKYMVTIDRFGNIYSIYDKELRKDVLAEPIQLGLFDISSNDWPSWELKIADYALKAPTEYVSDTARTISIVADGPARVALQVVRNYKNSEYTQTISLDAGSDIVRVDNSFDWWETDRFLKSVFTLNASNSKATYDLGAGSFERANNTQYVGEVPAQKWADITDASGSFGVSILSDSKNGWDKPADNILRLTNIHTPQAQYNNQSRQNQQDRGINEFAYAIYAHAGKVGTATQVQAQMFVEPMSAFQTVAHDGELGSAYSFGSVSTEDVIIRAIKLAEQGTGLNNDEDAVIVRFNEGNGTDAKDVEFTLGEGIVSAKPVWGSEEDMDEADVEGAYRVEDGKLIFDMEAYQIRAFALKLADSSVQGAAPASADVVLPYDVDFMSSDDNKADTDLVTADEKYPEAIPTELVPDVVTVGGVDFAINGKADGEKNMVAAAGQTIDLPEGDYTKLYLLATSRNGDKDTTVTVGDSVQNVMIADYDENVASGQMYNSDITLDRFSKDVVVGLMATHRHIVDPGVGTVRVEGIEDTWETVTEFNDDNSAADSTYLFKIELDIPEGATSFTLPNDKDILIASATVQNVVYDGEIVTKLYDEFGTTDSVKLGDNYFFGFEDTEVAALENVQGTGAGASTAVTYKSGSTKDEAHTGEASYKLTVAPTAAPNGGYAYAEMYNVNIPVKQGTKVSFWLKATNEDALFINLDGYTSNGISLRDYPAQATRSLKDQAGRLMHPQQHGNALLAEETETNTVVGDWKYYEYDFSSLAGNSITDLIFAFDVGGNTAGRPAGETIAYIDDLYVGTGDDTYAQLASAVMLAGSTPEAERNYSDESLEAYKAALNVAKVTLNAATASKEDADAAAAALVAAYNGLAPKVDENPYDEALFVQIDTDKSFYQPNEMIEVTVRIPADATKFGLRNEAGKYLTYSVVSKTEADEYGFVEVTANTKIGTAGSRKINLDLFYGKTAVFTDASKRVGISKFEVVGDEAVAVSSAKAPLVVKKSENFTITVETPTSASKVGIFDATTGKALGKVSENFVDKDGVREWTITLKIGSKGYRQFNVKAADGFGEWSNIDSRIALSVY